jgi:membrane-associated protease RseP (regulator of RpoE activity)
MRRLFLLFLIVSAFGQTAQPLSPIDPGMYVEAGGNLTKIIGQIAEFKRTGSLFVSSATAGIKARKVNIQLPGAHAQTFVSPRPVFYFVPAKQEEAAGVNAGDLILIKLEEKASRRQFEIAANGLWRASSGISLTHQIQLLRSEVKVGVYEVAPAAPLGRGEYALYLSRGEGMAAYVYDFSVEETAPTSTSSLPSAHLAVDNGPHVVPDTSLPRIVDGIPHTYSESSIGAFTDGNPDVRHDGITLTALTPGGPAEQAGLKAGDVILAIDNHYLFTIRELQQDIARQAPGTKISIRYRRYATIYEASLIVTQAQ